MSLAEILLPEFDHEMASTRRMLERVPEADAGWRPHPKSYSLGDLAAHIARLPKWGRYVFELPELDLGSPANAALARARFTTAAELVDGFDRNVQETRVALAAASDAGMAAMWSLRNGETTIFSLPRAAVFRSFILSHLIHHRGQLSVYLRLRNVALPPIYGPTADAQP